jgi:hypothetical protein
MEEIIKPRNKHAKIWAGSSLSHSWEWEGAHLPVVRRAVATPGTMGTGPCTIASLEGSIPTLSWTYPHLCTTSLSKLLSRGFF